MMEGIVMSNKYMVKVAVVALLALILVFGYFSFVNDGMGEEKKRLNMSRRRR